MAQILVKAKQSWMVDVDRSNWTHEQKAKFVRRTRKGSPIVIRRNSHIWGLRERLPGFVIIKMMGKSVTDLNYLITSTYEFPDDDRKKRLLKRRYHVKAIKVNEAIANDGLLIVPQEQADNFLASFVVDRNEVDIDG